MSKDTKEPDLSPNNKATTSSDHGKNPRATFSSSSSSSSALWFRLKDPRIARVSRAFGGKDRHSKVCTIKGLRDRRVRLSVPTAIQLYDLQDRLGLSQPSKVIDWLLEAAKHEIDELPPLPEPEIPIGDLSQLIHHQSKDAVGETEDHDVLHTVQPHDSSLNYLHSHFEPPNVPSAHTLRGFIPQHDQSPRDNGNLSAFSSTLSLSSGPPFSVYQPSRTQAFYAHHLGTPLEIDPRNVNSFHIPTSTSSQSIFSSSPTAMPPFSGIPLRPLNLSLNYPKFPSQNSFQAQPSKD